MVSCAAECPLKRVSQATVLSRERVSLTCEVQVNNDRLWWLTRESGDICEPQTAKACIAIKVVLNAMDAVVTRCWKVVAICALEPSSMYAVRRRIMPWLRQLPPSRHLHIARGHSVREFYSLLNEGMFTAVDSDCTCSGLAVCRACRRINVNSRRFFTQHQ